jgi:probable addiction module antidote protein
MRKSVPYEEVLYEDLKDPKEAVEYLNAAIEDKEMPEVFLLALRDVAEAWGFTNMAETSGLNRENLYKMLSEKGNPRLSSLQALLDAMGMRLTVTVKENKAA